MKETDQDLINKILILIIAHLAWIIKEYLNYSTLFKRGKDFILTAFSSFSEKFQ